jgi:cell shape-determining protein MreD
MKIKQWHRAFSKVAFCCSIEKIGVHYAVFPAFTLMFSKEYKELHAQLRWLNITVLCGIYWHKRFLKYLNAI